MPKGKTKVTKLTMTVPIFFFWDKKKIKDFIAQKKEDAVHRKYILKKTETERKEKE